MLRKTPFVIKRDPFLHPNQTSYPANSHPLAAHKYDTPTSNLANLIPIVVQKVLASLAQPLNVVPLSLHMVKVLEHFPTANDSEQP